MAKAKKTVREKLAETTELPKIVCPKGPQAKFLGPCMVVPSPQEVDSLMKNVRKGKVALVAEHREKLAAAHEADSAGGKRRFVNRLPS